MRLKRLVLEPEGVLAVLFAGLTFGTMRLARWSWWGSLIFVIACGGLLIYGYSLFNKDEFLENINGDLGVDEPEWKELADSERAQANRTIVTVAGVFWFALISYLFWIRKDFFGGATTEVQVENKSSDGT